MSCLRESLLGLWGDDGMKSALGLWLVLAGLIMSHAGCCSVQMRGDSCGMSTCGTSHYGTEPCGTGGCGNNECGECRSFEVPFSGVGKRVVNRIKSAHCSSGCGEIYWDEHINDPPVCDPCGCNGEFTGERCGSCPTALGRLRNLWGYRYRPSGNDGCSSCADGHITSSGSSTCSSCSSGPTHETITHNAPARVQSSQPAVQGMKSQMNPARGEPTPAVPRIQKMPEPSTVTPIPDPNAMRRARSNPSQVAIGSGISFDDGAQIEVPQSTRSVKAKPTSTTAQAPRRLVTNPK